MADIISRTHSFCGHTILQWYGTKCTYSFLILLTNYCSGDEPMVVLDARSDWRFAKNVSKPLTLPTMAYVFACSRL